MRLTNLINHQDLKKSSFLWMLPFSIVFTSLALCVLDIIQIAFLWFYYIMEDLQSWTLKMLELLPREGNLRRHDQQNSYIILENKSHDLHNDWSTVVLYRYCPTTKRKKPMSGSNEGELFWKRYKPKIKYISIILWTPSYKFEVLLVSRQYGTVVQWYRSERCNI